MLRNNYLGNIFAEVITVKELFASAKPSAIASFQGEANIILIISNFSLRKLWNIYKFSILKLRKYLPLSSYVHLSLRTFSLIQNLEILKCTLNSKTHYRFTIASKHRLQKIHISKIITFLLKVPHPIERYQHKMLAFSFFKFQVRMLEHQI